MNIVIIGLSLSSSWGNGHATTYRSLIKGLHQEGHRVLFLERDLPWYSNNRDLHSTPHCELLFYKDPEELFTKYADAVRSADMVIAGSYLKDGVIISDWITDQSTGTTAFYDIDTPVTLSKLRNEDYEYIDPELIPRFDLYLSFSGGPTLSVLEEQYGAASAKPLYCSVDPDLYYPETIKRDWKMGYLGTYSTDRQPPLHELLLKPAKEMSQNRFVVAGSKYPSDIEWPKNVERFEHLPPDRHRNFYNRQQFTLNVTRKAMIEAGYSPSVRLFEAAACAVPVISDSWKGIETFFEPEKEILIARSAVEVLHFFRNVSEEERVKIGQRARKKVLSEHTSRKRARQLAKYFHELNKTVVYQN